jgi:hypothetical protein
VNRRYAKISGLAVAIVIAIGIVVQIVVANTGGGWTAAFKYGRLGVPDAQTLRLPAGSLDISLRGVTGFDAPSDLRVAVTPAGGGSPLTLTHDVGEEFGPTGRQTSLVYRRIWKADIPATGAYRVVTGGPTGDNVWAIEFGHAPKLESGTIWAYTGLAALAALILSLLAQVLVRARRAA